jgi:hypothetical protein
MQLRQRLLPLLEQSQQVHVVEQILDLYEQIEPTYEGYISARVAQLEWQLRSYELV